MKHQDRFKALLLIALLAGTALIALMSTTSGSRTDRSYAALGFAPMSAEQMQAALDETLPVYLLVVYAAFNQADERSTYDTLASVTHGAALEDVYLDRVGAPAQVGLRENSQKIHEVDLLQTDVSRRGDELSVLATWQIVGTVSHSEHTHVRGRTFGAAITLAPVEGAWKITRFALGDPGRNLAALTID